MASVQLLEATNLLAGMATLVIAGLVAREVWRLRLGFPPVAIVLTAFFVALAIDRVAAPDPFLGYSRSVDALTDVVLILLLAMLLSYARRLARAMLATIDEARWRAQEYERARHDYSQLVVHRIANPLTAIKGAAHTLERSDLAPDVRDQMVRTIIEAADRTARLSLDPERAGPEEHELDATIRER